MITKKYIKDQLDKQTVCGKFWNSVAVVDGIKVARVCWHHNQYKVIPLDATFDQVSDRSYKPLESFYYQQELVDYIYNQINK